jgi:hypothetical protein
MNFNTQDLMQLTSPDIAGSNQLYGTRDQKNYRSLPPSGLGTVQAEHPHAFGPECFPGSTLNRTHDARVSEQIYQTEQQQRHDTFRDESFINQQR